MQRLQHREQVAQLSLSCHPTLVRQRPPRSCENNITPSQHSKPSVMEIPSSYRIHIWYGKTIMADLLSNKGRMMIDSVVWAQYIK